MGGEHSPGQQPRKPWLQGPPAGSGHAAPRRCLWTLSCVVIDVTGKFLLAQHLEASLETVRGRELGPAPGSAWPPAACGAPGLRRARALPWRTQTRRFSPTQGSAEKQRRRAALSGRAVSRAGLPCAPAVTSGRRKGARPFTRGCSRFGCPAARQEQDWRTGDKEGSRGGGGQTWDRADAPGTRTAEEALSNRGRGHP